MEKMKKSDEDQSGSNKLQTWTMVLVLLVVLSVSFNYSGNVKGMQSTTDHTLDALSTVSKIVASDKINNVASQTDPPLHPSNSSFDASFLATNTVPIPVYHVVPDYRPGHKYKFAEIIQHRAPPRFRFHQVDDVYKAKLVVFTNDGKPLFQRNIDLNSVMQNAVVVQWSGERPHIDAWRSIKTTVDIGSGHPHGPANASNAMEYYRLPYGIVSTFDVRTCWLTDEDDLRIKTHYQGNEAVKLWQKRKYNASMIVGKTQYPREEMFKQVESWLGWVTSPGKGFHNTAEPYTGLVNKFEYVLASKFVLCPENAFADGYVTEKLYHVLMRGAIPIYWPQQDPEPRLFNSKRIIYFDPANPEAAQNKIQELMTNDQKLLEFFNEPVFVKGAKSYAQSLCNDFADGVVRRLETLLHKPAPDFSGSPYHCRTKMLNSKSQEGQDKFMFEHAFRGVCHGTFVELGGSDGIENSNTYAAEVDMGWRGVLIEASPTAYQKLAHRRERNHSHKLFGVVGDKETNVTYIEIDGPQAQLSTVKEFASSEHLKRIEQDMTRTNSTDIKYVTVPMKPLTTWLEMHGLTHVNWLCLDVGGAELIVLKTLDFTKTEVDFFQINKNGQEKEIMNILVPHGYQRYQPWSKAYPNSSDMILCRNSVC